MLVAFPVYLNISKLNFPKSLARSKNTAFLITQVSPLYCHFAFSDLNIFSGTCSRVVCIQYPFFSVRNDVYMCVCVRVCVHIRMYVCMHVCVCMYVCV